MRLIDADALVESLFFKAQELRKKIRDMRGQVVDYYSGIKTGFVNAAIVTNSFPTIEPKKGKWTKHAEAWSTWWTCSECGWDSIDCDYRYDDDGWYVEDVPMSYCPCCGAKMERSEE